eukprot:2316199-Prymnesium_polylepis.1
MCGSRTSPHHLQPWQAPHRLTPNPGRRYFELLLTCDWKMTKASTGNPQMACDDAPGLMMLTTDHALVTDPALRIHTEKFAAD